MKKLRPWIVVLGVMFGTPGWPGPPALEAVGGVSLPGVPPVVAVDAVKAGAAAREAITAEADGDTAPVTAESNVAITISPGTTELVRVARGYLNRIVTPFENPKLLTTNSLDVKQEGASIYLATASDKPVGVYILPNDPADTRSISLTLIPARIPPKTITLRWPDGADGVLAPASTGKAKRWEEAAPYEEKLFELSSAVARGQIPEGYSLSKATEHLRCELPDVKFVTGQHLSGSHFSVFVLRATNTGRSTLEVLSNAGCNVAGVVLVAAWPRAYLEPGASTEIYVAVNNDTYGKADRGSVRPSLLTN